MHIVIVRAAFYVPSYIYIYILSANVGFNFRVTNIRDQMLKYTKINYVLSELTAVHGRHGRGQGVGPAVSCPRGS